jgi:hypothetical protein
MACLTTSISQPPKAEAPIHQLSGIGAIGPNQAELWKSPQKLAQHQLGAITVFNVAASTTTANSNPMVSTTIWRLRPFTFLPAS